MRYFFVAVAAFTLLFAGLPTHSALAKTVWVNEYQTDFGTPYSFYLISEGDTAAAPGELLDAFLDTPVDGLIDPADLLTTLSPSVAGRGVFDLATTSIVFPTDPILRTASATEITFVDLYLNTEQAIGPFGRSQEVDCTVIGQPDFCDIVFGAQEPGGSIEDFISIGIASNTDFRSVATDAVIQAPVPLPAALPLFAGGLGLLGLLGWRRKRMAAAAA